MSTLVTLPLKPLLVSGVNTGWSRMDMIMMMMVMIRCWTWAATRSEWWNYHGVQDWPSAVGKPV